MLTPLSKRRPRIFISYRRDDSEASTDFLLEQLVSHFGRKQIFVDVDDILLGEDVARAIEKAVGSCDILLAVVGKQWLTITNAKGRRLDSTEDFVRLEIVTALKRDILLIPVLVQGASMPSAEDLPDDLRPLARRQAFTINRAHRKEDASRLIKQIEKATSGRAVRPARPGRRLDRHVSTAAVLVTLLVLTSTWRLFSARRGEDVPPPTPTPTVTTTPTAPPAETSSPSPEPALTPTPSTRAPLPTPSPAPTGAAPEPEKTPAAQSEQEKPTPTPTPKPTPPPSASAAPTATTPTPTPAPLVIDLNDLFSFEPTEKSSPTRVPAQEIVVPTPTPTPIPTYEQWKQLRDLQRYPQRLPDTLPPRKPRPGAKPG